MRLDTAKRAKKSLKILKRNGFREPFQIVVDNAFIKAANQQQLQQSSLNEALRSEPKLFMTKCTYETHKKSPTGTDFSGCCEIVKCGHDVPDPDCAYQFIKEANPNHYILASTNPKIISKLRESKHIPVLKLFKQRISIDLNQMSTAVVDHSMRASKSELRHLKRMFG